MRSVGEIPLLHIGALTIKNWVLGGFLVVIVVEYTPNSLLIIKAPILHIMSRAPYRLRSLD